MTQTSQILEYLLNHPEGITPLEALEKFGCFRLGARIWDIKNGEGLDNAYAVQTINETRGGKTYARYVIPQGSSLPVEFVNINLLPEMRLL